jgi:hypothetical protein
MRTPVQFRKHAARCVLRLLTMVSLTFSPFTNDWASAANLTGACIFTAVTNGTSYWPAYVWDTLPGPPYANVWLVLGSPGGQPNASESPIVSASDARVNWRLHPGLNYFTLLQDDPGQLQFVGLNLFLNGRPEPLISVKAWLGGPMTPFSSNTSTQTHGRMDGGPTFPIAAAGTLVHSNPLEEVTLVDFYFADSWLWGLNRVGNDQPVPDGAKDFTCIFALAVKSKVIETSIRLSEVEICWYLLSECVYQLQHLSDTGWSLMTTFQGNDSRVCVPDRISENSDQKIYRVLRFGDTPSRAPTLAIHPSAFEICWHSDANRFYQLQYSGNDTAEWFDQGPRIAASPPTNCTSVRIVPTSPMRFYRVIEATAAE